MNDLLVAIKNIIKNNFQESNVYSEGKEESFIKPYFSIKISNSSEAKELNRRYKRNIAFEISYVSDKDNINEEYLNKADELYELLEIVEKEERKLRALNMNHEVKDGGLYFKFQLEVSLIKNTEENSMKQLEVDVNGK
ncbi:DUF6838 family protein [Clostridium saccharoperbutylacetonicum]|uniref:phage tail terminator family protein n=1 Tax=Clostridium saccharoperbutylacetonicum TaxID=36745 RepID=UPI0039EC7F3A